MFNYELKIMLPVQLHAIFFYETAIYFSYLVNRYIFLSLLNFPEGIYGYNRL